MRFRNEVTTCSDFPSEAMLWIKEVEICSIEWMNWSRRGQLRARNSWISKCWTRGLLLLCITSSRTPTSRIRSVWRNRKPKKRTGVYEEDRSRSSSTTAFGLLVLMIQFSIALIYFLSLFVTIMFRNLIQEGTKFLLSMTKNFIWWYFRKSVQTENTRVCASQKP